MPARKRSLKNPSEYSMRKKRDFARAAAQIKREMDSTTQQETWDLCEDEIRFDRLIGGPQEPGQYCFGFDGFEGTPEEAAAIIDKRATAPGPGIVQ